MKEAGAGRVRSSTALQAPPSLSQPLGWPRASMAPPSAPKLGKMAGPPPRHPLPGLGASLDEGALSCSKS